MSFAQDQLKTIDSNFIRDEYLVGKGWKLSLPKRFLLNLNYYTAGKMYDWAGGFGWLKKPVALVFRGKARDIKETIQQHFDSQSSSIKRSLEEIKKQEFEIKQTVQDRYERKNKLDELEKSRKKIEKLQKGRISLGKLYDFTFNMQQNYYLSGKEGGGLTFTMLKNYLQSENGQIAGLLSATEQELNNLTKIDEKTKQKFYELKSKLEGAASDADKLKIAIEIQQFEIKNKISSKDIEKEDELIKRKARLEKLSGIVTGKASIFEFDTNTAANLLVDFLTPKKAEQIFSEGGNGNNAAGKEILKKKLAQYGESLPLEIDDMQIRFKEYGSIKRDNKHGTSAQNRGDHIAVDIVQNLEFEYDEQSKGIKISPNLIGRYNVGEGAHEFIHSFIAQVTGSFTPAEVQALTTGKINKKEERASILRAWRLNNSRNPLINTLVRYLENAYPPEVLALAKQNPLYKYDSSTGQYIFKLELGEMEDNEIITRFLSDMFIAEYLKDLKDKGQLKMQLNSAIANHLFSVLNKSNVSLSQGRGMVETIIDLARTDAGKANLMRYSYNFVKGPRYRSERERVEDRIAKEVNRIIKERIERGKYIRDNEALNDYERLLNDVQIKTRITSLLDDSSLTAEEKDNIKENIRVAHSLSSISSGPNTSITDHITKTNGRKLSKGEIVTLDVVLNVGENGASDTASSYIVNEEGRLQEINPFLDEDRLQLKTREDFKKELDNSRLKGKTKQGFLALYDNFAITIEKVAEGAQNNKEWEEVAGEIAQTILHKSRRMSRFAYFNKIHELFGSDRLHSFGFGHFKNRGSLKGRVAPGEIFNLEPFVSVPGFRGFKKEIQVNLEADAVAGLIQGFEEKKKLAVEKMQAEREAPYLKAMGDVMSEVYTDKKLPEVIDGLAKDIPEKIKQAVDEEINIQAGETEKKALEQIKKTADTDFVLSEAQKKILKLQVLQELAEKYDILAPRNKKDSESIFRWVYIIKETQKANNEVEQALESVVEEKELDEAQTPEPARTDLPQPATDSAKEPGKDELEQILADYHEPAQAIREGEGFKLLNKGKIEILSSSPLGASSPDIVKAVEVYQGGGQAGSPLNQEGAPNYADKQHIIVAEFLKALTQVASPLSILEKRLKDMGIEVNSEIIYRVPDREMKGKVEKIEIISQEPPVGIVNVKFEDLVTKQATTISFIANDWVEGKLPGLVVVKSASPVTTSLPQQAAAYESLVSAFIKMREDNLMQKGNSELKLAEAFQKIDIGKIEGVTQEVFVAAFEAAKNAPLKTPYFPTNQSTPSSPTSPLDKQQPLGLPMPVDNTAMGLTMSSPIYSHGNFGAVVNIASSSISLNHAAVDRIAPNTRNIALSVILGTATGPAPPADDLLDKFKENRLKASSSITIPLQKREGIYTARSLPTNKEKGGLFVPTKSASSAISLLEQVNKGIKDVTELRAEEVSRVRKETEEKTAKGIGLTPEETTLRDKINTKRSELEGTPWEGDVTKIDWSVAEDEIYERLKDYTIEQIRLRYSGQRLEVNSSEILEGLSKFIGERSQKLNASRLSDKSPTEIRNWLSEGLEALAPLIDDLRLKIKLTDDTKAAYAD
jgi:hypothetical protein